MIPKVFHRIWLGPYEMPDQYLYFEKLWMRLHPRWQMRLWDESNMPPLLNQKIYDQVEQPVLGRQPAKTGKWVQRADIASYEIVYTFGGVYLNCDMEPLRDIEPLLEDVEAFAGYEQGDFLSNAIMGCTAGHPAMRAVIDLLPWQYENRQGCSMNEQTGPHLLSRVFKDRDDVRLFEKEIFTPFLYTEMDRQDDFFPSAYTKHRWGHMRGDLG